MTAPEVGPSWQQDPTGRYEYRWWDGAQWTDKAASGGKEVQDPIEPASAQAKGDPLNTEIRITTFNAKKVAAQLQAENAALRARLSAAQTTLDDLGAAEATEIALSISRERKTLATISAQLREAEQHLAGVRSQLVEDRERVRLETDFGLYDYEHPAEVSADLSTQLASVRAQIKALNSAGSATQATSTLTFEGSRRKGQAFVNQMSRVMLRWYNAEAESAVKSVKAGNLESAQKRLERVQNQVQKHGRMIDLTITHEYHLLRLQELELASRHLKAVAVEKERERERRAQLREERKVEAELAREKERLNKERAHYQNSIDRLLASGDEAEARELKDRLAVIDEKIAHADYRTAEHPSRIRLHHLQYRGLRFRRGQDRHDAQTRPHGPRTRAQRCLRALRLRRPRPVLQR